MCSHLQYVQSFTTCPVIYNMCSHLQHVQSFTTCPFICNMSNHLQHVQSFTTCPVIYNMTGYTLISRLQFSRRSLLHDGTFAATCPGSNDTYSHLQHVPSLTTLTCAGSYDDMFRHNCTTCPVPYNMCTPLRQHVLSYMYNMSRLYNKCRQLRQNVPPFKTCSVIYNMCSHLQHVQSFTTCPVICNQHVQSFTT
jgi:hypothetical protein